MSERDVWVVTALRDGYEEWPWVIGVAASFDAAIALRDRHIAECRRTLMKAASDAPATLSSWEYEVGYDGIPGLGMRPGCVATYNLGLAGGYHDPDDGDNEDYGPWISYAAEHWLMGEVTHG